MSSLVKLSILDNFSELEDPRIDRCKRHELLDIIAISLCGVISGMQHWEEIEEYGKAREEWFSKFLKLPNGIPSHDTFRRVFMLLEPKNFQKCFSNWITAICSSCPENVIAIDGKCLRRSFDKVKEISALHLVSAWSCANNFVLGQLAVEDKSNEIVAIPQLLDMLTIRGHIFTLDAMGCQKRIAEKIVSNKGDYVFSLKDNHPNLRQEAENFFSDPVNSVHIDFHETVDGEHGRIETRKCSSASANLFYKTEDWIGVASVSMIESTREINGAASKEKRYFISSLDPNAKKLLGSVRTHWQIENTLHWSLDNTLNEDQCRIRERNSAQNFATLRRMAGGLIKNGTSEKKSIRRKMMLASWNTDYLIKILQTNNTKNKN
ncbi:MAG: ISAs1 family transposase [Bdellovibrionales bacterium]|nr:ISAs1 family transposase [Bdellovibrionales bacterium]